MAKPPKPPPGSPDWQERVQESKNAKESSLKLLKRKKRKKKTKLVPKSKKKSEKKVPKPLFKDLELDSHFLESINPYRDFLLDVDRESPLKPVDASRLYREIAALLLQLCETRGVCLVLTWPAGIEWIGLTHILVNRYISSLGGESGGMRVLQYPSTRANSTRYRNTHIPAKSLLSIATSVANEKDELPERIHTYFALRALELNEVNERELNPSSFTLIPLMEFQINSWKRLGSESLIEIRRALHGTGQYQRREHLDAYAKEMDSIEFSSETNLRVPPSVGPSETRRLIRDYKDSIDVVCLDIRSNNIKNVSGWLNPTVNLALDSLSDSSKPPILIFTDEPDHYTRLEYEIGHKLKKTKDLTLPLTTYKLLRRDVSPWRHEQKKFQHKHFHRQFDVRLCAVSTLHDIQKINDCARDLQRVGEPQTATEIRKLGGFLRRICDSPSSQEAIRLWVKTVTENWSSQAASAFSARFSWQEYRLKLVDRLKELGDFDEPKVKRALEIADEVVSKNKSSELENHVCGLLTGLNKRKATVVLPSARHITPFRLANADLIKKLDVNVVSQKDDLSSYVDGELIIAGMVENLIPQLLLDRDLASKVHLICSGYSGLKIQRTLASLLSFNEFAQVHDHVKSISNQLDPLLTSFQKLGAIHVPSGELILSTSESDHHSEEYGTFYLEGYGELAVAEHSVLLRRQYDTYPMFRAISASSVMEGDVIFVMEDDIREIVEETIKDASLQLVQSGEFIFSQYLQQANAYLSTLTQSTRAERVRLLLSKMEEIDPSLKGEINEGMVARWVKGIEEQSGETQDLHTKSAKDKEHFLLFAKAMWIDSTLADIYWDHGIRSHRAGKILEGKYLSSVVRSVLCEAISAQELGISDQQYKDIRMMSDQSTHLVSMIELADRG